MRGESLAQLMHDATWACGCPVRPSSAELVSHGKGSSLVYLLWWRSLLVVPGVIVSFLAGWAGTAVRVLRAGDCPFEGVLR
jgi:hypothetical protein